MTGFADGGVLSPGDHIKHVVQGLHVLADDFMIAVEAFSQFGAPTSRDSTDWHLAIRVGLLQSGCPSS